jgi:intraflagellar transport protein 80
MIKTVQANRKNLQWTAHDGIVLCVDWNVTNQHIISGGEDCVYHVWDSFGRMMYSSKPMENVISAVKWSPNGDVFAVGLHNHIRLCDKTGWTHCKERISTGSLMNIAWTSDGTQFAAAGGNGSLLFAQLVNRHLEYKNTEVILIEPRKLRVQDPINESIEDLEFPRDRIVEIGIGFEMLIVTTTTQCYLYSIQNLNTPMIFDLKAPPNCIHICRKHFLLLDPLHGIQIFTFEGRGLSNLRFQGLRPEYLSRDMISLSPDMACVVDTVEKKVIYVMDPITGRMMGKIAHSTEVLNLNLNQQSVGPQERLLAFSDRNKDFYLAHVGILASGLSLPSCSSSSCSSFCPPCPSDPI